MGFKHLVIAVAVGVTLGLLVVWGVLAIVSALL